MENGQLKYCKVCINRKLDFQRGMLCSLTNEHASFDFTCPNFKQEELQQKAKPTITSRKTYKGRSKVLVLLSILLTFSVLQAISQLFIGKLSDGLTPFVRITQLVLFVLLFNAVYEGKEWGRTVLTILLIITIIVSITHIARIAEYSSWFLLFLIIPLFHGYIIYFLFANKDYINYMDYKREHK